MLNHLIKEFISCHIDLTLIKLDENANQLWINQYGSEASDLSFDVAHDSNNNVYIVGRSQAGIDGNKNVGLDDTIIMKWNSDGLKQ